MNRSQLRTIDAAMYKLTQAHPLVNLAQSDLHVAWCDAAAGVDTTTDAYLSGIMDRVEAVSQALADLRNEIADYTQARARGLGPVPRRQAAPIYADRPDSDAH